MFVPISPYITLYRHASYSGLTNILMDQCDELFHFSDNMEELMTQLDELEEDQQFEPVPQVMAALPQAKRPTRKTTRKGAGKRKVHFGEGSNDRWQQC